MFYLIGEKIIWFHGYSWEADITVTSLVVAKFTTRQGAEDYIEKARLKSPIRGVGRVFKMKSVLKSFQSAKVEEEISVPLNPTINV